MILVPEFSLLVMAGIDPAIHPNPTGFFSDGLPGQARQ
jgi:hypothetical protein